MKITDLSKILECFQKEFSLSIPLLKPILENNEEVIIDKNVAYGFIIGDPTLIPKRISSILE